MIISNDSSPVYPSSAQTIKDIQNFGKPKGILSRITGGIGRSIDKTIQRIDSNVDRQYSRNKAANGILKLSDDILNNQKKKTPNIQQDAKQTKEYKMMQDKYITKGVYHRVKTSIGEKTSSTLRKIIGRPSRELES